jgi:MFS superfamily sulfate permease-like transporter
VILDARIFVSKNGYYIDADREFAALGVSQIASAISEGFCVGSLDSGAALVDVAKGRTQLAGLISIGTIVVVMSLCMPLLAYVPGAALAVIVLSAALAMTDMAICAAFSACRSRSLLSLRPSGPSRRPQQRSPEASD